MLFYTILIKTKLKNAADNALTKGFLSNNYSLPKNIKLEKIFTNRLRVITFSRYLALIFVPKFFSSLRPQSGNFASAVLN